MCALLVVLLLRVSHKLKLFTKPDHPNLSTVIRANADWINFICFLIVLGFSLYTSILILLTEIGYTLSNPSIMLNATTLKSGAILLFNATKSISIPIFEGSIVGLLLSYYLTLKVIPNSERGEGLHDVRDIISKFKKLKGFDPLTYVDINKGCFVGLDLNKKPIFIPWLKFSQSHKQVLGTSGTGKGILMAVMAHQCIAKGEAVIWIDPKSDRYSPIILEAAAKKVGKDFHLINLNQEQPPQFNLLADATANDIEDLLVAGFDLIAKGTDADYHKGKDVDAAIACSKIAAKNGEVSLQGLHKLCSNYQAIKEQDNFWRKFNQLVELEATNTINGINLTDAINKGSVIYVVGSIVSERVKLLQKMLLVRLTQIILKQDRLTDNPITKLLILDEFKHILSPIGLSGLGAIRDFNTHIVVSHQTMGDLDACASVSQGEAEGAVVGNTAIKFVYKIDDTNHAAELSKNSGKVPVYVEQASKSVDDNNVVGGNWRQTHRQLIDADVFTHLPMSSDREGQVSAGVVFGIDEAKVYQIDHIRVSKKKMNTKTAPRDCDMSHMNVEDLI